MLRGRKAVEKAALTEALHVCCRRYSKDHRSEYNPFVLHGVACPTTGWTSIGNLQPEHAWLFFAGLRPAALECDQGRGAAPMETNPKMGMHFGSTLGLSLDLAGASAAVFASFYRFSQ
mmetsp:Transcript_67355/g.125799  ORF Transcript_67355/g.125799 Transcript_67355/m.125799 type:complete len:118 (-) Transcript_67355:70-423(-)